MINDVTLLEPRSAAQDFVKATVWGSFSRAQFSFLLFPKTVSAPPLASFQFQDFIRLFPSAVLFILAAHVLSGPSAVILSEVTGGHLVHQVLRNSHGAD